MANKKGHKVFNYTDNIFASEEIFPKKKEAKIFVSEFREKFKKQGYYRDNRWNKISPEHIDLEIIPEDFNPFKKESISVT